MRPNTGNITSLQSVLHFRMSSNYEKHIEMVDCEDKYTSGYVTIVGTRGKWALHFSAIDTVELETETQHERVVIYMHSGLILRISSSNPKLIQKLMKKIIN